MPHSRVEGFNVIPWHQKSYRAVETLVGEASHIQSHSVVLLITKPKTIRECTLRQNNGKISEVKGPEPCKAWNFHVLVSDPYPS